MSKDIIVPPEEKYKDNLLPAPTKSAPSRRRQSFCIANVIKKWYNIRVYGINPTAREVTV